MHNLLLKKAFVPPTAEFKILKHCFTLETVQKVYESPFQIKCDIKITMFYYKIIHNILATKGLFLEPKCRTTMYALNAWLKRTPSIKCSAHLLQPFGRPSKTGGQTREHSD